MPQFDQITFFNQIHWLSLTFLSLYYMLLIYIPRVLVVFKARAKRIALLTKKLKRTGRRYIVNLRFYRFILFRTAFRFKNVLLEHNTTFELWASQFRFNLMSLYMNPLGLKHLFKNTTKMNLLNFV